MGTPGRKLRLVLLSLLAVGIAFGTLEAALRARPHVFADGPPALYVDDAERGLVLRPGACARDRAQDGAFDVEYCIDDRGFRRTVVPEGAAGPPILLLGGANVFGLGVADDQTTASRLAKRLGRQVVNAGVPGSDLADRLATLVAARREGVGARLVVVGFDLGRDWRRPDEPPGGGVLSARERWLRLHLATCNWLWGGALFHRPDERLRLGLLPEDTVPFAARLRSGLRALALRAANAGPESGLVLLMIPTRYQVDPGYRDAVCGSDGVCADGAEIARSADVVQAVSSRLSLPRVDMLSAFTDPPPDPPVAEYTERAEGDQVWTPEAHAAAAEDLARMIFFIEKMQAQARARALAKEKP